MAADCTDVVVYCCECNVCGPGILFDQTQQTEDDLPDVAAEAVEAWNRRAYLAATKPPLAGSLDDIVAYRSKDSLDDPVWELTPYRPMAPGLTVEALGVLPLASPPMPGRGEGFVLVPVEPLEELSRLNDVIMDLARSGSDASVMEEELGEATAIVIKAYRRAVASPSKEDTQQ
jgi:hypothetical protein